MMGPEELKSSELTQQEIYAIRSLEEGTADAHAQRLALATILKKLCRAYDQHYVPGDQAATTFLLGRAYPGQQLIKYLRLNPTQLKKMNEDQPHG